MTFSFWDNFGRIMPHMKSHVASILRNPEDERHNELIKHIMDIPQSQQYLFARDIIIHDVDAFCSLLNGMVGQLNGKHLFDDQECAFFLSQLLHKRGFRYPKDSDNINEGIAKLLDGYNGIENIFANSCMNELPGTASTLNLEKIDAAVSRYIIRIVAANTDILQGHAFDDLLINYKLPKAVGCWLSCLHNHADDRKLQKSRVVDFVHHLIASESTDVDYLKACVNALGLQKFADTLFSLISNRSLDSELKILATLYGENSFLTEDRLTLWGKQASYGQATKTLAVMASSNTEWECMPRLLSLTLKNLPFYHHEMMGFLPHDSLVSAAIANDQQLEFAQGLLLTTVDPLLNAQEANKHQLTRLLEGVIANAQGGVAPPFMEKSRAMLKLIANALSAKGAEHMPPYVDGLSAPGKQYFFAFLNHENTDKKAFFDRFPDAKRATLSSDLGL